MTKDKQDNLEGESRSARAAAPGTSAVPARPGPVGNRPPPQYPQSPRRPPNIPNPSSPGGGGSGGPSGPRPTATSGEGGYFRIYKKGQGYWTRMGTVAGAALIGGMTIQFVWSEHDTFQMTESVAELASVGLAIAYALFAFYILNHPRNVDFLIATDSEMKKVNWTSQKDLLGSTRVVILFMFIIAIFLFVMDILFGYFFYLIGVLKEPPF
ncbi:MAG TPA: preprotein translocase subunit SecE [Tepidisphaeraceae bacterium]|nr:preprotein translocase subunit SecE [Tepidisphaeraceae bacterium]